MGYLEGNFTPVLYIERKVPEGLYTYCKMMHGVYNVNSAI